MSKSWMGRVGAFAASVVLALGGLIVSSTHAQGAVDVYVTPGPHNVNGRQWRTACEPYSATERCRTEIWATQVSVVRGRFVSTTGWVFNNLTYKASPRELWRGNPIAADGKVGGAATWTTADGRNWRTECDTAVTGRGGCRSYIEASVIAKTASGYAWRTQWILNNMVRFSPSKPAETFEFIADAALRACVKEQLGTEPPVMLSCNHKGVKSLEGIQRLTGLIAVQLIDNKIEDLTPLGKLPNLRQVDVTHNLIEDLTPLANMPGLWHLTANDNYIETIAPLAQLNELYTVELGDNLISDISPLTGKRHLWNLDLSLNLAIDDLTVLKSLTNLEQLRLDENYIDDLTPLASLTKLRSLSASDNFVSDVTPLAGLKNLELLYLDDNELGDVGPLKALSQLRQLWLGSNPAIVNLDQLKPLVDAGCDIDIWPAS